MKIKNDKSFIGSAIGIIAILIYPVYHFLSYDRPLNPLGFTQFILDVIGSSLILILGLFAAVWVYMAVTKKSKEAIVSLICALIISVVLPGIAFLFYKACSKYPERDANGNVLKNGQYYDSQEEETGEVWICIGRRSHAYHSNENCYGLQSCRSRKKKILLDKAIAMGRTPCHYCHEETATVNAPWEVYICPNPESRAYHYDKFCNVLMRCADEEDVITITFEEAMEDQRTPCYKCAKENLEEND